MGASGARDGAEDRLLQRRVEDAARLAAERPRFLGFLDPRQRRLAESCLRRQGFSNVLFWGGYEGAERVWAGLFPAEDTAQPQAFPVRALRAEWSSGALSHRDFLGAVLSLGVERRAVGDILVSDGSCVLFLDANILPFVLQNLDKVGGARVTCGETDAAGVGRSDSFIPIEGTIASARLDCVVATLLHVSRGEAARVVESGRVSVDYEPCEKPARPVSDGAAVSVRGSGRFEILQIGPATKKGRLRFSARKFQ